jgi:hypothetical protein
MPIAGVQHCKAILHRLTPQCHLLFAETPLRHAGPALELVHRRMLSIMPLDVLVTRLKIML